MNNSNSVIIIMGPPGSGKGTQSNLLSDKFGFFHLESSKLIEKTFNELQAEEFVEIDNEKYFFAKEKESWSAGELNSPPFVLSLIKKKVEELSQEKRSIVFSGSPRTLGEAEGLMPILVELFNKENINILLIELSAEQSIWRNSHRRICELIRHPILYVEETKELKHCPMDGSKLITRALDDPEIIKERLKEYENRTMPVIDYLQKQDFKVQKINGEQSVADVFADIMSLLT